MHPQQRRPLTALMRQALPPLERFGAMRQRWLTMAEKNTIRALYNRELVGWDIASRSYSITPAGRVALRSTEELQAPGDEQSETRIHDQEDWRRG